MDFKNDITVESEQSNGYGNGVSCFQTTNLELIICFYSTENSDDNKIYLNLIKYDKNLENPVISDFESNVQMKITFLNVFTTKEKSEFLHIIKTIQIFYILFFYSKFMFKNQNLLKIICLIHIVILLLFYKNINLIMIYY